MFHGKILAGNIKTYRAIRGLSQHGLAAALGVSPQSVSKWECGIAVPDIENLCLLSDILGVSIDRLLGNEREHKKIMIAIDGGGSKTEFVMFTEDGAILERLVLGACNPNIIGVEASAALFKKGIDELLAVNASVSGIYIGSSGFMLGGNADKIRAILRKAYPHARLKCDTDILNVIAASTESTHCIAAICGTGAVVFAKEGDTLHRLSGWGYLLSKSGSGYDIGRDALHAVLADIDGIGEKTLLTSLVEARLGKSVSELIGEVYRRDLDFIASFAPLVFDAYEKGDAVASTIVKENAEALCAFIRHAAKSYQCGSEVILSGGVVKNAAFADAVKAALPTLNVVVSHYPQVLGAALLCLRTCELSTEGFREKFMKSYKEKG